VELEAEEQKIKNWTTHCRARVSADCKGNQSQQALCVDEADATRRHSRHCPKRDPHNTRDKVTPAVRVVTQHAGRRSYAGSRGDVISAHLGAHVQVG